jgi:hypothetical protein
MTFANKAPATNTMGATSFIGGGTNVTINQNISNVPTATITYINTNKELIGTVVNYTTATFPAGWITAPPGLPATSLENFTFFCNGQLIEKVAVTGFSASGGVSTLTIDPSILLYGLEASDIITAIGKFDII